MLSQIQTKRFFSQCNYTQVALFGDRGCWETYAACALIGKTSEALDYFRSYNDCPEALFYEGVAHWMNGEDELAYGALDKVNNLHAQNLRRLIQKKKIHVLAQVPWIRNHFTDWLAGVSNDPKFQINNISFHPDDIANKPYADIHQFYTPHTPPDFYICQMVEWHLIPPNIQELACPIFGQTADYDLHIQAVYPWLQLFDELLVTDGTEWNDISKLVSVPVSTFPKSFCLLKDLPELQFTPREIDLYLSGTVTHPYHPDKAHLLSQILRIPELNIKVVHGFTGTEDYYENLSKSKVCFTYVRHPGATSTRGLEALGLGCALVVQEESVLRLFVGEEEGVITYSYDQANLASQLTHVAQNWSKYQEKAHRGARVIRAEFSTEKVASQYLRYLTVLAAKPGVASQRQHVNHNRLFQKRTVLEKGWLPSHDFGQNSILKEIYQANRAKLANIQKMDISSPETAINLTREIILFHYHKSLQNILFSPPWLREVEHIYQEAINQFPKSLILHFNLFRTRIHFGSPVKVSQAIKSALQILEKPLDHWEVSKWEDVFPYDIFDAYFNYRSYFDCLVTNLQAEKDSFNTKSIQLILASIHYYLGLYTREPRHLEGACFLDPAFAKYKMGYLRQGISNNKKFLEGKTAKNILIELVLGTTEFLCADQLIQRQCLARNLNVRQLLGTDIPPIHTSINVIEHSSPDLLKTSIGKLVNPFKDIAFTKKVVRDSIKILQRSLIRKLPKRLKDRLKNAFFFSIKDSFSDCMISISFAKIQFLQQFHTIKPVGLHSPIRPKSYSKDPKLVGSTRHHNYVLFGKTYYGIPQSLGDINLNRLNLDEHSKIIREPSLKALKLACRSFNAKCYSKAPKLLGSTKHYNYVLMGETYYGVPKALGELNLQQLNLDTLDEHNRIIREPSLKALKLACRNFNAKCYSKAPKLLGSTKHYNYVLMGETYYGVPKALGELNLQQLNLDTLDEHNRIIREPSLKALKLACSSSSPRYYVKTPKLVGSTQHYNCVLFEETYYGIPKFLGDLDLHKIHLDDYNMIICESSLKELMRSLKGEIFSSLRLKNSNIVKTKTCESPGSLLSLSKVDLLKEIYAIKHSPFMIFNGREACLDTEMLLEAMPAKSLLQTLECLGGTRGGQLRLHVSQLVKSMRSFVMHSLNIQVVLPWIHKVSSRYPTLVESWASYHLFCFSGAFYGVPVAFGDVNLKHFEKYDAGSILFDSDLASLKRRITQGQGLYAEPTLLESLTFYYVVAWGQDFYAVPTIYGNLEKNIDPEAIAKTLNANHKIIFRDISVVNLRRRVKTCEFIYRMAWLKHAGKFAKHRIDVSEQPTEEILLNIGELEQTQVWRLRVIGWRIKQKLLAFVARFIGK